MDIQKMDEEEEIERALEEPKLEFEDMASDILTHEEFELFLVLLFQSPPGEWLSVPETCLEIGNAAGARKIEDIEDKIARACRSDYSYGIYVTWLPSLYEGDALVVVFRTYPILFSFLADYFLDHLQVRQEQEGREPIKLGVRPTV